MSDGPGKNALKRYLNEGFFGCVHISPHEDDTKTYKFFDTKVLILQRFDSINNNFCGFIPNEQISFYDMMKEAMNEALKQNKVNDKMDDLVIKKKNMLRIGLRNSNGEDAVIAMEWLQKNRDKFSARVYQPMLMYINVKDAENYAKFFEAIIPLKDLISFSAEKPKDVNALKKHFQAQNLKVDVIQLDSQVDINQFQPKTVLSDEKKTKYGFKGYLKDMFSCPNAIKSYLQGVSYCFVFF